MNRKDTCENVTTSAYRDSKCHPLFQEGKNILDSDGQDWLLYMSGSTVVWILEFIAFTLLTSAWRGPLWLPSLNLESTPYFLSKHL